jgi:hypothetical protein
MPSMSRNMHSKGTVKGNSLETGRVVL